MSHWRMKRALRRLQDGELPEAGRPALQAHLERCRECAAGLARQEETDRLLRAAAPRVREPETETYEAIFQQALIQSGALRRSRTRRWHAYAWGLPVAALLAAGGWWRSAPTPRTAVAVPGPLVARVQAPEPQEAVAAPTAGAERSVETAAPVPAARKWKPRRRRARALLASRSGVRRRVRRPRPEVGEPAIDSGTPEAVSTTGTRLAGPPQLLVMLTAGPPPAPAVDVKVTEAPPDARGYACVEAVRPASNGTLVWSRATITGDQPAAELVVVALTRPSPAWATGRAPQLISSEAEPAPVRTGPALDGRTDGGTDGTP